MSVSDFFSCIATVPRPFEEVCAKELSLLGATSVVSLHGAVSFEASCKVLYRINLCSFLPNRILVKMAEFPCESKDDLYQQALGIPFEQWVDKEGTFAVYTEGKTPFLRNTMFSSLVVKDALVDRFYKLSGGRPSVDKDKPDVLVQVYFEDRQGRFYCTLLMDSSLVPLYQRGYREQVGQAPLKETLAASLIELCEKSTTSLAPFVDLFCGSGTFLIELALKRTKTPPGRLRDFGFMKWKNFDNQLWSSVFKEAESQRDDSLCPPLLGCDIKEEMIQKAQRNSVVAGVSSCIQLKCGSFENMPAVLGLGPGTLLLNPPYGHRLSTPQELSLMYKKLGQTIRQRFSSWNCYVLTSDLRYIDAMGLFLHKQWDVKNGDLDAKFCYLTTA